jgi:SAM-dependent MidA family methyltransferase
MHQLKMDNQPDLPSPDKDALAHSRSLAELIRDRVAAASGWIDFSEFMDLALYAPGLGYYSAGARKFGAAGDFVTAPEISRLFGRCIGRFLSERLRGFSSATVLEVGAGTGAMAADILAVLEREDALPDRYLILEVSADLRQRQAQTIGERVPELARRVEWLDSFPESPFDGVVVANEVLDALPVTRFVAGGDGVKANGVCVEKGEFAWRAAPAPVELREAVRAIEAELPGRFEDGYASELCPSLPAFIAGLGASVNRGLILLVDYGLPRREFYHADRSSGTLRCHYRHRAHSNPFVYPGLQDITAWVDFTGLAEAAVAAGLDVAGYTTQAQFLLGAGVDRELAALTEELSVRGETRTHYELASQLKTLTLPGEMGERFKVMGLTRGIEDPASTFPGRDFRHLL